MSDILTDIASERGVNAAICLYGKDAYLEVCDIINVGCFTQIINQNIYTVLDYIYKKDLEAKVDLAKILSAAKELGLQKSLAEENSYIQRLFSFKVELENTREFGRKLKRLEIARSLVGLFSDTQEDLKKLTGAEPLSQITSVAEKPIFDFINSITNNSKEITHFAENIDQYIDSLSNEEIRSVDIEFPIFQEKIGSLRTGLHVVAARPGKGKSTFALQGALKAAKRQEVLLLDTEMDRESGVWDRALSMLSGIEVTRILLRKNLTEAELYKLQKAANKLKTLKIHYYNISGKDFNEALSMIRRWLVQHVKYGTDGKLNKCLIVYDYIKMTDYEALKVAKEYELIGMRMSGLHDLTMMYDFPILTFIQLNKEYSVAQSDRVLWFCTSMSYLLEKSPEEIAADGLENGNRKLVTIKARFGEGTGDDYINYQLIGKYSTMKELGLGSAIERDKPNEGES